VLDNTIDTVLFDMDGTLLFHEPDSFEVIGAYCTGIDQPISAEAEHECRRAQHEYFVDPINTSQLGGFSPDEFWHHFNRHLLQAAGVAGDLNRHAAQVTAQYADIELTYECPELGYHTLTELRSRGYKLGLVTNRSNVDRLYELLDEMGLRAHFDMTLASGEVGVAKPDPGLLYAALERIDSDAQHAVYIGDNYWADVVGARRAGITPVLLDPHHIFPEADCLLLERIDDLLLWLPARNS